MVARLFVVCPPAFATGGPEALHQLAASALNSGFDASMVYNPQHPDPVHPKFAGYGVPVAEAVVDRPDSVVVVPEILPANLFSVAHARRALWWLSVDAFEMRSEAARRQLGGASNWNVVFDGRARVNHFAQSEYARLHVAARGAKAGMVTDYIPGALLQMLQDHRDGERAPVIAFNPAKGLSITKQVMARLPQFTWLPLTGMASIEMVRALQSARLYVDFGEHPGRDRLPREAAAAGCVVIVGRRGSAANEVDVPLPEGLKVAIAQDSAAEIAERVLTVMHDPVQAQSAMEIYRKIIFDQEGVFHDEVFTALSELIAGSIGERP